MAWCCSEQILWMLFGECGLEIWRILFGVFGAPNLLLGVLWLLLLWFCPFNNGKMLKHILAAHQYCVPVSLSILAFALFSTYAFLYMFIFVFMYLWYLCILVIQQWWLWEGGGQSCKHINRLHTKTPPKLLVASSDIWILGILRFSQRSFLIFTN